MNIGDVKKLCKNYDVYPSKKLGQNFLVDANVLRKIIKEANLLRGDVILEIGPGIGNLTVELAKKAKMVLAIEKDKRMCKILKDLLKDWGVKNVEIINEDILKIKETSMGKWFNNYKLVANLPYYITAPVIRKFLETKKQPQEMILMVQKEVAQRICAQPPKMTILAVSVQFYAQSKIISFVSKKSFWPQPKVDSAIIKIVPRHDKSGERFREKFFQVVRAGFSHPRKQLVNNLRELEINKEQAKNWLLKNGVRPDLRAQSLTIEDWRKLTKTFKM